MTLIARLRLSPYAAYFKYQQGFPDMRAFHSARFAQASFFAGKLLFPRWLPDDFHYHPRYTLFILPGRCGRAYASDELDISAANRARSCFRLRLPLPYAASLAFLLFH